MKIDFDKATIMQNFYGGNKEFEAEMFLDNQNRIIRGKLIPGASIGMHMHETSSEIIYILSGKGNVVCDGVLEKLVSGDCHYCPKGSSHTLANDYEEDLVFFAVVPQQ